jgi:cobalt/nickel transport system permease protein
VAHYLCLFVKSPRRRINTLENDRTEQGHDHHHGHDVGERLYIHRHSLVHSIPAQPKIVAGLLFIAVCISTPISNWLAFSLYFFLVIATTQVARLPIRIVLARSVIEVPFIFFALLMPFFGTGERFALGPLNLYREGLLAGAAIVAKGTLGILVAINLSSTSTARDILRGLELLRLPKMMVQIASFMLRYVNVVNDEMERMKVARASRGFEATGIKHWKILATAAGALFIRSYERGERVHLAMLSRGYAGHLPRLGDKRTTSRQWILSLTLPAAALLTFMLTTLLA